MSKASEVLDNLQNKNEAKRDPTTLAFILVDFASTLLIKGQVEKIISNAVHQLEDHVKIDSEVQDKIMDILDKALGKYM